MGKGIYHYTPIQLSLSLSKEHTCWGWGGMVEKRKKEKRLQVTTSRMHQGTCNRITKEMNKGRNNNSSLPVGLQKYSYQQPNPSQPASLPTPGWVFRTRYLK